MMACRNLQRFDQCTLHSRGDGMLEAMYAVPKSTQFLIDLCPSMVKPSVTKVRRRHRSFRLGHT